MPFTFLVGFGFVCALGLSLVLTWGVREWARDRGLVDRPDCDRKAHESPTPNLGGVAIFVATGLTLGGGVLAGGLGLWPDADLPRVLALAVGGTLVWILGLVDDVRGLSVWSRFGLEVVIAGLLVAAGVRIDMLGMNGDSLVMIPALVAIPLTIVWIVGVTNAFNLLDGSDGVAGGSALIALLTLGVLSLWWNQPAAAATCFVLAGAVAGFLYFNFPPASIFMGDSGSLFLGFSLASLGVLTTQNVPTLLAVAIPLVAFGVPVLDTLLAMVRRVLRGDPVHRADRGHIHHRLRQLGHSPRKVALVVWGLSGALGMLALLLAGGEARISGVALGLVGLLMVFFVQRLRVPELLELGRLMQLSGARRARIDRSVKLRTAIQALDSADTPGAVLDALRGGFTGSEYSHLEIWFTARSGGSFASLEQVRKTLHGYLATLDLSAVGRGPEVGELDAHLTVPGRDGATLVRLVFRHGRWANRFPTDFRLVLDELVPALGRAVERVEGEAEVDEGRGLDVLEG